MDLQRLMSGGAPCLRKYQVSATVSVLGVPHLVSAAGAAGLSVCTTTGCVNMVGINTDTATYATAQQSDGSDPDALCTFITNPDAVWKIPLSGGATENTALTMYPITTASSDGLTITTSGNANWASPTYDEGTVWGYDGANAGIVRKITSVSGSAITVTVALPRDTVVGDNFLFAPIHPFSASTPHTLTLTTALTQARQDVAVASNTAEFICIAINANDISDNGRYTSSVLCMSRYHALNATA
jgi:hypothetical protein